jgi:hypothetical protein
MAFSVRGHDLLPYGAFLELVRGLDPNAEAPDVLRAWWEGEDLSPNELHRCLDIECRLLAINQRANDLIDYCLDEIERLFPDEVPH